LDLYLGEILGAEDVQISVNIKSSLLPGTIARGIVDFHQKNAHFFYSFLLKQLSTFDDRSTFIELANNNRTMSENNVS